MFRSELEGHLKRVLESNKVRTFDDVFKMSNGAFPDTVYAILKKINATTILESSYSGIVNTDNLIPEPNISNFDWRFDRATITYITDLVIKTGVKKVALFGAPSLFLPLMQKKLDVTLYDINLPLRIHFKKYQSRIKNVDLNIFDFADVKEFDCIIMDPPWYIDYYGQWLKQANKILKNGGHCYVTLFQPLLRPKARVEIKKITHFANLIGKIKILKNRVSYVTPIFEKELFNYNNIPCFGNWRKGDLLIVKKQRQQVTFPKIKSPERDTWIRLELGTQTIALKPSNSEKRIKVRFPYEHDDSLLKSVSNRDSIRKQINFITSRNRGLIVEGVLRVTEALKALQAGMSVDDVENKIKLTSKEINELHKILNVIYK